MVRAVTSSAFFHGALRLEQPRKGYRFTEDAIYLAAFAARGGRADCVLDFGTGCGVVGLVMLHQQISSRAVLLEIQPSLAYFAARNVELNGLENRAQVIATDFRSSPLADGSAHLVVSNPPYMPRGIGNLPANRERALARHELCCTPSELAREADRCLVDGGRLCVVYPENRWSEVNRELRDHKLAVRRVQHVKPFEDAEPLLVLIEAIKGLCDLETVEEAPLVARREDGGRTEVAEAIFAGSWLEELERAQDAK